MHLVFTTGFPGDDNEGGVDVEITREVNILEIVEGRWTRGKYKGKVVQIFSFPDTPEGQVLFKLCEMDGLKGEGGLRRLFVGIFTTSAIIGKCWLPEHPMR